MASIIFFNDIKKKFKNKKTFQYHNFFITYYYNNNIDIDIKDVSKILSEFKTYTNPIKITMLQYYEEKKISSDWKDYISGFCVMNTKEIFIIRIIEWQRTLIHELVHACFNITNEIKTEQSTIKIYKRLFGFNMSQVHHSLELYEKLSKVLNNNLMNYLMAYLYHNESDLCKCKFDDKIFRYICS